MKFFKWGDISSTLCNDDITKQNDVFKLNIVHVLTELSRRKMKAAIESRIIKEQNNK
jgi:hypothetical protein